MKLPRHLLPAAIPPLILALTAGPLGAQQDPLTYETPRWIFSQGDFHDAASDGRLDLVLVDKSDGTITIGLQRTDGGFDWTAPEPTGITAPSGLAVGLFNNVPAEQVAVTSADANRFTLFTPHDAATPLAIRHVYPSFPVTQSIAAFLVDGDAVSDLLGVGELNFPILPTPYYSHLTTNLDTTPGNLWEESEPARIDHLWVFRQKALTSPLVAATRGSEFLVATVGAAGLTGTRPIPAFTATAATRFTYGPYDGSALSQVILYTPGQTTARAAKVTEPSPGAFGWGALTTLTFPRAVQLIVTVPSTTGARLAVLFTDTTAATYDFNGTTLALRSSLPGNGYELLAPIGTHALLSRTTAGAWQRWLVSSTNPTLTPVNQGLFPTPSSAAKVSNVVFVSGGEPFVNPDAVPVYLGHVRDWTTGATGGGSNWSVTSLLQGPGGLGSPATVTYQPVPPATHALVNQVRSNVSIRTLEPTAGPDVGDLIISPPAGAYPPLAAGESFFISFATTRPAEDIAYRLSLGGAWDLYDPNNPPALTADATVQAFAAFGNSWSPTRTAVYTFTPESPLTVGPLIDSDGDGLPDQWEDTFAAYDPNADEDGDGSSNLDEFHNGTDPRDAASFVTGGSLVLQTQIIGSGPTRTLRLSWTLDEASAILQESATLDSWAPVRSGIMFTDAGFYYDVPLSGNIPARRFFRLLLP